MCSEDIRPNPVLASGAAPQQTSPAGSYAYFVILHSAVLGSKGGRIAWLAFYPQILPDTVSIREMALLREICPKLCFPVRARR